MVYISDIRNITKCLMHLTWICWGGAVSLGGRFQFGNNCVKLRNGVVKESRHFKIINVGEDKKS